MRKTALISLFASAIAFHSTSHADNNAVGVTLGTSGIGFEVTKPFTDKVRGRLKLSFLDYDYEGEEDDIEYDFNFKNNTAGLILDWHPFAGRFHLSMGVMNTAMEIGLKSQSQGSYNIGGTKYIGDVKLDGNIEFAPVSPYLGLGWNTKVANTGINFTAEIGVLMVGSPKVSINATGSAEEEGGPKIDNVQRNPEFQEKLEKERQELEDDLKDFKIWPGINIGIAYQF